MNIFPPFKRKGFFSSDENARVVEAIRKAEQQTSGEVRVFVESRCRFVDALDRAAEIFWNLKMDMTQDRNSVLVYVAMKDHQFAIFADKGIHERLGEGFWHREVAEMGQHFMENRYTEALVHVVNDIGEALRREFPYQANIDKNELPDDIVFGK
jgi:uncharacterized membrane protein